MGMRGSFNKVTRTHTHILTRNLRRNAEGKSQLQDAKQKRDAIERMDASDKQQPEQSNVKLINHVFLEAGRYELSKQSRKRSAPR